MKKLILLIVVLISHFVLSQTQTIEVYDYVNGIRQISPTKIIEIKENKTVEIYSVTNGIKQITPTQIIQDNKVYEVKNSIPELLPRYEIHSNPIILPTFDSGGTFGGGIFNFGID